MSQPGDSDRTRASTTIKTSEAGSVSLRGLAPLAPPGSALHEIRRGESIPRVAAAPPIESAVATRMSRPSIPSEIEPLALLEAMVESVLVTTTDLEYPGPTIVYANPAFERMTGWTRAEIVGRSPRVLQGPKTDRSVFADLERKLGLGETWEGRAVNYRKDGRAFFMEWSIAPVRDAGGDVHQYIAVQRDITARVEMERELRRTREAVIEGLQKREIMRTTFGKFVPESIIDQVLADAGTMRPDLREATILYFDIADFSTLAETLSPSDIIQFLNEYFSLVTAPIERHEGVIHQFQGDAVLATFNLPLPNDRHADHAVESAIEIQRVLDAHRFHRDLRVKTRFGINTGAVVAGTVGSPGRLGYTVHGDAVNLTARIEEVNKRFGTTILVSEATVHRVCGALDFRSLGTIPVRGRKQPVTLYTLRHDASVK